MIRNPDWYNLNEQRSWPIDPTATLRTDSGVLLPNDLIADIHVICPQSLAATLFIGSVTGGQNVASITLLADVGGYTPAAAVSVPNPDPYRMYALEELYPGVKGWVVFGSGVTSGATKSFTFSTAAQSKLQRQSCKPYRDRPILSLRKAGVATGLTGLVGLASGNDIEIVKETVEIDSVLTEAAVIRLKAEQNLEERNVFEIYAGNCNKRAESKNCGDPEPIEFINNVAPDCCGTITLEFRGCAALSNLSTSDGAIIDCGFGLSEACVTKEKLPDATGKLPNEYDDLCVSYSISLILDPPDDPIPVYAPIVPGLGIIIDDLPYSNGFSGASLNDMIEARGDFSFETIANFPDAAVFNGTSSKIDLTSPITLSNTSTWRVEGWHLKNTANSTILAGVSDQLSFSGTDVWVKDSTSPINGATKIPVDGNWFHFRFEKADAGTGVVEVFIDGESVGTKTLAGAIVVNKIGSGPIYFTDGKIKELRVISNTTEHEWPLALDSGDRASGNDGVDDNVTYSTVALPATRSSPAEGTNIAILDNTTFVSKPEWTTFHKEIEAELQIDTFSAASLLNGGIVFNYRASDTSSDRMSYGLIELSMDGAPQIKVRRFTGLSFFTEATEDVTGAVPGNLYRLRIRIEEASESDDGAWVTAWLCGLEDSVYAKVGPTYLPDYRSPVGNIGLFSNRSSTLFTSLSVRNNP